MNMRLCACIVARTFAFAAPAMDNGCLIQGTLTGNGISPTSNYCAANKGMSDQDFKNGCQDLFEAQGENSGEHALSDFQNNEEVFTCTPSASASTLRSPLIASGP
nr:hypothetical protein [uncultured Rhodoferax sp.]